MWQKACKKSGSGDYAMRKACYEKLTKGCKCDLAGKCDAPPFTPGEKPLVVNGAMLEHDVRVHGVQPAAKGFQLLVADAMAKAGAYVGTPQQGVPFTGPFAPLVPSNMAGPKAKPVTQDDLPDSAFLLIEKGGRRDSKGRTEPRELRKYQARDVNGMFDSKLLKACVKKAEADGCGVVARKASDILNRIGGSEA
jgi:hypothetical protein